jgi:hypothetical protein
MIGRAVYLLGMELTTEQRATLEKWLSSLLGKALVALLLTGWSTLAWSLSKETIGRAAILGSGVLLLLLVILGLRHLRLLGDRDRLGVELATAKNSPSSLWQPDDEARTVLCVFVDAYPQRFESWEIQQCLEKTLSDAKVQRALDVLDENGYLYLDDERTFGGPPSETYRVTNKGRIYIEDWRRERGF